MKASFSALRVPALAKAAQRAAFSAFFSAAPEAAALGAAGAGVPTIAPNDFGFGLPFGPLPLFLVSLEFSPVTLEYGCLISLCPGPRSWLRFAPFHVRPHAFDSMSRFNPSGRNLAKESHSYIGY